MTSLRFSMPCRNAETIKDLIQYLETGTSKNKIDEIYFSDPAIYGSGRIKSISNATGIINLIRKNNIKPNLIMNSTCEGAEAYDHNTIDQLIKSIGRLHRQYGLDSVTIANPLIIQTIKNRFPKIQITASVLGEIDSVQRAMFYDKLGADVIVPDRDINRDIKKLKEIKEAINGELRIMVNEGCMYRCPYRLFHFNYISHLSKENKIHAEHFFSNCHLIDKIDPAQVFKSNWIRPEDTVKYRKITTLFKISGRTRDKEWIQNAAKAYLQESYDGNILDLMDSNLHSFKKRFNAYISNKELQEFHSHVTSCDKNCHRCTYCESTANKLLKFKET